MAAGLITLTLLLFNIDAKTCHGKMNAQTTYISFCSVTTPLFAQGHRPNMLDNLKTRQPSIDCYWYYIATNWYTWCHLRELQYKNSEYGAIMPLYSYKFQYGIWLLECTRRYTETYLQEAPYVIQGSTRWDGLR